MGITLKSRKNLLDMIPAQNPRFAWTLDEEGLVHITVPRQGLVERLARRFTRAPDTLTVDLDSYGSFVWQAIDGKRNIFDIGKLVSAEYGPAVEPLYERLGGFMNLLKNNRLISYRYPAG